MTRSIGYTRLLWFDKQIFHDFIPVRGQHAPDYPAMNSNLLVALLEPKNGTIQTEISATVQTEMCGTVQTEIASKKGTRAVILATTQGKLERSGASKVAHQPGSLPCMQKGKYGNDCHY